MREICTSGSEGGGGGTTASPYPYHELLWLTDKCKSLASCVVSHSQSWMAGRRRP
jgi:hypothetical protein